MKKSKKNYLIIVLLVILLAIAVGYATFTANLTISGTATTGKFDVHFADASISHEDTDNTASVTTTTVDNDTVTVAAKLDFPGDGREVTVTVTNAGTIDAKLTGFVITGSDGETDYSNDDITITTPDLSNDVIAAGESCTFTFTIVWDEDSQTSDATADFKILLTYEQNTTPVTVNTSHDAHAANS